MQQKFIYLSFPGAVLYNWLALLHSNAFSPNFFFQSQEVMRRIVSGKVFKPPASQLEAFLLAFLSAGCVSMVHVF